MWEYPYEDTGFGVVPDPGYDAWLKQRQLARAQSPQLQQKISVAAELAARQADHFAAVVDNIVAQLQWYGAATDMTAFEEAYAS